MGKPAMCFEEGERFFLDRVYGHAIELHRISTFWPAPLREVIGAKLGCAIRWRQSAEFSEDQSVVGTPLADKHGLYQILIITPRSAQHGLIVDWLCVHELGHLVYHHYWSGEAAFGSGETLEEYWADAFALGVLVLKSKALHADLWRVVERLRSRGHATLRRWDEVAFYAEVARILQLYSRESN